MRLDEVKSYADLRDYFCDQAITVRACANWHANVRHRKKAQELTAKANWTWEIYRKMLEISDNEQEGTNDETK